jgi:pimeloyl-ACP methyl ester carboxylesterase
VADEVVCLTEPPWFGSVGHWYREFTQTSDAEVIALLGGKPPVEATAQLELGAARLTADLAVPAAAAGLVVFAHGSGSSRLSPRNQWVAGALRRGGFATVLFDLLRPEEAADRANVFDVPLLGSRLVDVTRALAGRGDVGDLPVGYFGASTGAAAALWAAAEPDLDVGAVVSRGGRPDLAGERLLAVRAPTLLVVGGRDEVVLELNRRAARQLACPNRVEVVPGAGHLFEEPGALSRAADLALAWFQQHLSGRRRAAVAGRGGSTP